jgi:hypothetical protein
MADRAGFCIGHRGRAGGLIAACSVVAFLIGIVLAGSPVAVAQQNQQSRCAGDNGGITLSPGFCATVFADNLGHARQMAFGPNGVLYVNTWSGRYYKNDKPPAGGFLIALKNNKGDDRADMIERFGDGMPQGSAGGTGIRVYDGGLYAEQRQDHPLSAAGEWHRAERTAASHFIRPTADRRSPDASVHHRCAGANVR